MPAGSVIQKAVPTPVLNSSFNNAEDSYNLQSRKKHTQVATGGTPRCATLCPTNCRLTAPSPDIPSREGERSWPHPLLANNRNYSQPIWSECAKEKKNRHMSTGTPFLRIMEFSPNPRTYQVQIPFSQTPTPKQTPPETLTPPTTTTDQTLAIFTPSSCSSTTPSLKINASLSIDHFKPPYLWSSEFPEDDSPRHVRLHKSVLIKVYNRADSLQEEQLSDEEDWNQTPKPPLDMVTEIRRNTRSCLLPPCPIVIYQKSRPRVLYVNE